MTQSSTDIGPFSIVPRWVAEACHDAPLALAIYVWLADHADRRDAGFTIGRTEIAEALGVSRATGNRAIEVLHRNGCISITQQRIGKQQAWSRFHVHQVIPQRLTHEPLMDEPVQRLTGEPVSIHQPQEVTPRPNQLDETFEKFWKIYPRKEGKKAAHSSFRSMVRRKHLEIVRAALPLHMQMWKDQGRPLDKIPHASTWLNQEKYMDQLQLTPNHATAEGKHKDAGRVMYDGANNRIQIQDDGSHKIIASAAQVNAE